MSPCLPRFWFCSQLVAARPSVPVCIPQHSGFVLPCPLRSLICPLATAHRLSKQLLTGRKGDRIWDSLPRKGEPSGGFVLKTGSPSPSRHCPHTAPPPRTNPLLGRTRRRLLIFTRSWSPGGSRWWGLHSEEPLHVPTATKAVGRGSGLRPRSLGRPDLDCGQLWLPQKVQCAEPSGDGETGGHPALGVSCCLYFLPGLPTPDRQSVVCVPGGRWCQSKQGPGRGAREP